MPTSDEQYLCKILLIYVLMKIIFLMNLYFYYAYMDG